jgi:hypothetical protein
MMRLIESPVHVIPVLDRFDILPKPHNLAVLLRCASLRGFQNNAIARENLTKQPAAKFPTMIAPDAIWIGESHVYGFLEEFTGRNGTFFCKKRPVHEKMPCIVEKGDQRLAPLLLKIDVMDIGVPD